MPRLDQGGEDALRTWIDAAENPRLIVIDTIAYVERPRAGREDAYTAKHAALKGLQRIANESGVAIVAVTHVTKSEYSSGDPFERITGSLAGVGTADTGVVLNRDASGTCTLYARGREIEEVDDGVEFSDEQYRWRVLSDATTVRLSAERKAILDALGSDPIGPKDIADVAQVPEPSVRQILRKMVKAGHVEKVGRGLYRRAST
jgi:hypothetical protein